jgi:uncharacterized protein with HEPN domain
MSRRSESEWLSDIIAWGERLQAQLAGIDREAFLANSLIQDAVSKCVEAIGEAAGKLDDLNPRLDATFPDLNLKLARRTRDRLSHGYYRIDLALLWRTVRVDIPKTLAAADAVRSQYSGGRGGSPPA